ncbi:hypothetical protein [Tepidanaerobacter syntrophicus]|uniref:hypothetical protein n=1 Tax=Tepidanaerobacter syntrophicus TaxID=224999 RepID=UPI001BD4EDA1|nr:hypothetical protein [Tepidanaerobacter syntrophicus]
MKEPMRLWIIITWIILVILAIPWFYPTGSYEPLIWGIPYWFLISLIALIILESFEYYVVTKQWDVERHVLKESPSNNKKND